MVTILLFILSSGRILNNIYKMNAAILVAQNQSLLVDEVEMPATLDVGQILVKVHVSGICGSQIGEIKGVKGEDKFLPHLLGHEGCGTVLDIGPGVKNVKKDDLVVLHWKRGSGIESKPPNYLWRGKKLNAGWVTTFNSHAIVSENRCTSVPKDTDKEIAALCGCAITTGFGVIENNVNLQFGQSVIVFGAGGIGLNIIQASNLKSAWPIIAVDLFDNRLKLAKELGATHVVNSSNVNFKKEILEIIGKGNLDVFIDNTGIPEIIEFGYEITHHEGKIALVGVPKKGNNINIFSLPLHFGKVIIGSHGGECKPERDINRYLNMLRNKEISLKNLISKRYKLHEINEAIDSMIKGVNAGRILIEL